MNRQSCFKALVYGASGMAGGELLRIISGHPALKLAGAVSRSKAGSAVGTAHPHLRHIYSNTTFISPENARTVEADIAFTSLPHGKSAETVRELLDRGLLVVDLSADFRLKDPVTYEHWYGTSPSQPELLREAVYGLPELHRTELATARLVSGVGCNATASILCLYPLARLNLIQEAFLDIRAGSSEGGSTATAGSHHPFRSRALRIVEPFSHRHLAEAAQELSLREEALSMRLSAVETVRGVQACADVVLSSNLEERDLWRIYRDAYGNEPFVHLCPARPVHQKFPDPRLTTGSNNVQIGFALRDGKRHCLVVSALDNLMKGAAGSAVQSANLMLGLPEVTGLNMQPVYPV